MSTRQELYENGGISLAELHRAHSCPIEQEHTHTVDCDFLHNIRLFNAEPVAVSGNLGLGYSTSTNAPPLNTHTHYKFKIIEYPDGTKITEIEPFIEPLYNVTIPPTPIPFIPFPGQDWIKPSYPTYITNCGVYN